MNISIESEDDDTLQGEGVKTKISYNLINFYTRLEILLWSKPSGHNDTLTEASNVIDEINRKLEIENKLQHGNALDKFPTI